MWVVSYLCRSIDRFTDQAHVNANTNNFTVTVSATELFKHALGVCPQKQGCVFIIDGYLMFYAQSTTKGHIRVKCFLEMFPFL